MISNGSANEAPRGTPAKELNNAETGGRNDIMTIILATMAKFIVAAGFLSLGALAIGGTALASEPSAASTTIGSVTYPVGFSDLDVSSAKGAKTLYLRIRYAAGTVCESAATWGKKEGEACVNKAVNDAVARIDAPRLTQSSRSSLIR